MKTGTSLYLDVVRFLAALAVFAEHFREHTRAAFAGFWRLHPFWYSYVSVLSQTAVTVFFVLSGYVIAHVLATRERTPLEYAASRFGRLYSVVLPALALVAFSHFLVELRHPNAFHDFDAAGSENAAVRYMATALLTSHFWIWPRNYEPPAADPFWSLSYEAAYYVAIGLVVFARGWTRILCTATLALIAGPSVVLFAPIWLIGYSVYRLAPSIHLRSIFALMLWLPSTALLLLCPVVEMFIGHSFPFLRMPDPDLGHILASYAAGLCFAVGLIAFDAGAKVAEPVLRSVQGVIRWLGSVTFALYLFHQPLLNLFSVYPTAGGSYTIRMGAMIGGTLLLVATLGRLCEKSKASYKRAFLSSWRVATGDRFGVTQAPGHV